MIRYRFYLGLLLFVVPFALVWRVLRGKDTLATFYRRFFPAKPPMQNVIWLHAVSLGELNVLVVMLKEIQKKSENEVLVTVSNIVALKRAKETIGSFAHVAVAPLDNSFTLRRFFRLWKPSALLTIENEVFANRITFANKSGIPIFFINGRMSKRSYARWSRHADLAAHVFPKIDRLWAQDTQTAEFFEKLGTKKDRISNIPNLKRLVKNPQPSNLPSGIIRDKTMLAASTHAGEEEIVIDAFKQRKLLAPDVFLILAPRHPDRRKEVLALLKDFKVVLRSTGAPISKNTDILLADSFHEMDLWYQSAAITLVAGSLKPIGGHTPYEPNQYGSAIIHGPHFSNFKAEYDLLKSSEASIQCDSANSIFEAWKMLQDSATRHAMLRRAKKVLGSTEDLNAELENISKEVLNFIQ